MSISLTGVNTTTDIPSNAAVTGSTDLGEETFLRLLTTQLQNQDPTNPVSNEEFVAQLAQFSSLETLQTLSDQTEALYLVNASMNNAAMANLMGQGVVARSDTFHYDGAGSQEVHYDAASAATDATITISDADGNVVYTGSMGALVDGEGSWTWDGNDQNGQPVAEGDYTFTISATDAGGEPVEVTGLIHGTIDEMSFESGSASPSVDGVPIAVGDIVRLISEEEDTS